MSDSTFKVKFSEDSPMDVKFKSLQVAGSRKGTVRYDVEQSLSDTEKETARNNIGVEEQVQADWAQNDVAAVDYIQNRPFYIGTKEPLGKITYTATSSVGLSTTNTEDDVNVLSAIFSHRNEGEVIGIQIGDVCHVSSVDFTRGWIYLYGWISAKMYYNSGKNNDLVIRDTEIKLVSGQTYDVEFYYIPSGLKQLSSAFMPNSVFSQRNAPVINGVGNGSAVQGKGTQNRASGVYSFALGEAFASGNNSVAAGFGAEASGVYSHAEGYITTANRRAMFAIGERNLSDDGYVYITYSTTRRINKTDVLYYSEKFEFDESTGTFTLLNPENYDIIENQNTKNIYVMFNEPEGDFMLRLEDFTGWSYGGEPYGLIAITYKGTVYSVQDFNAHRGHFPFVVGNGADNNCSNAHTLDWDGNAWFAGDVYVGSTSGTNRDEGSKKLVTEKEVKTISYNIAHEVVDNTTFSSVVYVIAFKKSDGEIAEIESDYFLDNFEEILISETLVNLGIYDLDESENVTSEYPNKWLLQSKVAMECSAESETLEAVTLYFEDCTENLNYVLRVTADDVTLTTEPLYPAVQSDLPELIISGTVETAGNISITTDSDGNPLNLKSAICRIVGTYTGAPSSSCVRVVLGDYFAEVFPSSASTTTILAEAKYGEIPTAHVDSSTTSWQTEATRTYYMTTTDTRKDGALSYSAPYVAAPITKFEIKAVQGNCSPDVGLTYELWGVRNK